MLQGKTNKSAMSLTSLKILYLLPDYSALLNLYVIFALLHTRVCLFRYYLSLSEHFKYCLVSSSAFFSIAPFFFTDDFKSMKFGNTNSDEVETDIKPRPNSYLHIQKGDYDEPIEMYIQTDEGIVSHLSQIGPRPRSAR